MDENIKIALKIYIDVMNSLKKHCNNTECKKCCFSSTCGICILERKPHQYNIEQIEDAVLKTIIQELEEKD